MIKIVDKKNLKYSSATEYHQPYLIILAVLDAAFLNIVISFYSIKLFYVSFVLHVQESLGYTISL